MERAHPTQLSGALTFQRHLLHEAKTHCGGAGQPPSLIHLMKARIDTPPGRKIYTRRLGIVEPVFANIRVQKRLDHFTLRSKAKVDVQCKLFTLVHNLGKIQQYGRVQ